MKEKSVIITRKNSGVNDVFVEKRSFIKYQTQHHWHDCIEFELLLKGTGTHYCNNKAFSITRGNGWLLSLNDSHRVEFDSPTVIYNVAFSEMAIDEELRNMIIGAPALVFNCSEEETVWLEGLLDKLAAADKNAPYYKNFSAAVVSILVSEALRKSNISAADVPRHVQRAVSYVHKNFKKDITLKSVAEALGLSSNYLGKLFADALNTTFNEYLNSWRLHYACSLLENSSISVKEIAFESGYRSTEYFLYVFKKTMKTTPLTYRFTAMDRQEKKI